MSTRILSHFSDRPLKFNPNKKYKAVPDFFKPMGLWLSDETAGQDSWRSWCEGEQWGLDRLKHETLFECDTRDWIVLPNFESLLDFSKEYSTKERFSMLSLDWHRVSQDFKGILITPYHWKARFHPKTNWYYPWDCASACVWDLSTVKALPNAEQERESK